MCQDKDKGGKRCLKHAAISKFTVRLTRMKTGAPVEVIEQTLSQLNKEGKHLPAPDTGEVKTWIDTKKFATQFDPELDDHERKIQLNQLNRANTEVEAGVTGGNFHAWKNIMGAVRSKMAKRVAVAGLVVGMTFSFVGCFANDVPNPNGSNGTGPTTSISQEYGDATGSGETVTDEYGAYEPLTVEPDSPSAQIREAGIDQSVYDAGYTNEDVAGAQYFASKMVVEQFLDSSALDTGAAGYANWQSTVAPNYFYPDVTESMAPGLGHTNLTINTSTLNAVPQLVRDGKPRISSLSLSVDRVYSENRSGVQFIGFEYSYKANYRASDASIIDLSKKVTGLSEQDLTTSLKPEIFDGAGENNYNAYGSINLGIEKQGDNYISVGASSYHYYDTQTYTQK